MPIDPANLPPLLAGPMVRRLTLSEVSVWCATAGPLPAELVVTGPGAQADWRAPPVSFQLGARLWAHMFTFKVPGGDSFQAGAQYSYIIEPQNGQWPTGDPAFNMAAFWADLGPGIETRPGFVAPPARVEDLRFGQVSCRKPHGGSSAEVGCRDALALFDASLQADPDGSGGERLHIIMHTGDQIYADDVASALMTRVVEIANDLVGGDEPEFHVFGDNPAGLPPLNQRTEFSAEFGLTAGAVAHDHLWRFGEFAAMYLLAWSDALWPASFPAFAGSGITTDTAEEAEAAEAQWNGSVAALELFRETLPAVRRVLANTANFLMFDDHEVTDDWNLDYAWISTIYENPVGRQVIRNGLAAYAAFQHWGNVPDRFAQPGTPENTVMAGLSQGVSTGLDDALALPPTGAQFPAPDPVNPLRTMDGSQAIRFDYRLGAAEGWPASLVALDPRTARAFPGPDDAIGRIAPAALEAMLPSPADAAEAARPLILSLPAPFLGVNLLEHFAQPAANLLPGGRSALDVEPWTAYGKGYETFIARLAEYEAVIALSGDVHYGFTRQMTYAVGNTQVRAAQFTASASKNAEIKTMAIHTLADFMTDLTLIRPREFYGYDSLTAAERQRFIRPPQPGPGGDPVELPWDDVIDIMLGRMLRRATEEPAVFPAEVARAYGLTEPPSFSYTVDPVEDELEPADQAIRTLISEAATAQTNRQHWDETASLQMLKASQKADLFRMGRVICGLPQAGALRVEDRQGQKVAVQDLLVAPGHRPGQSDVVKISTEVEIGPGDVPVA
ncbi:MAG: hypothetical protein AAF092_04425 [Pseudomonadota bacterium]